MGGGSGRGREEEERRMSMMAQCMIPNFHSPSDHGEDLVTGKVGASRHKSHRLLAWTTQACQVDTLFGCSY